MSYMLPNDAAPNSSWTVPRHLLIAFDTVAVASSLSMGLFLLTTRLDPRIHRSKSWYTMFITLALFPLAYLMTVAWQFGDGDPPFGLCIFQAALIYAAPPTASTAVLGYMMDVALGLHAAITERRRSVIWDRVMPWLPATVFFVVFSISIMIASSGTTFGFDYARMFCGAGSGSAHARISASITLFTLIVMILAEIWIVFMLIKNRRKYDSDLQVSMAIRFGIFTLLVIFSAIMAAVVIPLGKKAGATWNVFLVTVPFVSGLAFGTHRDLLRTWKSWILPKSSADTIVAYSDLESALEK